jgi:hypothetical protein
VQIVVDKEELLKIYEALRSCEEAADKEIHAPLVRDYILRNMSDALDELHILIDN